VTPEPTPRHNEWRLPGRTTCGRNFRNWPCLVRDRLWPVTGARTRPAAAAQRVQKGDIQSE